jgi:hypothetical protein
MKFTVLVGLGVLGLASLGCGVTYPVGSIYSGTQTPHGMMRLEGAGAGKGGAKTGEACASGFIFNAIAIGDATLAAAKKAGGVTDVHSVEFGGTNILGLYTQGCTIVYGN